MRTFTVDQLIARAQQRCDMENQTFVNDTSGSSEWQFYLSSAYSELHAEIVKSGMRHFETTHRFTTDGTDSYALPGDFLAVVGVDHVWDTVNGRRRQLDRLMAQERNSYRGRTGASDAVGYAIVGSGATPLELHPKPPTGQTYELVYIPHAEDLTTASGDTLVDVVAPAGEEFLLWAMSVLSMGKEKDDVTLAMAERERHRASLQEWAALRAFNDPNRVIAHDEIDEYAYPEWRTRGY